MTTKITFTFKLHLSDLKFRRIFLNLLLPISNDAKEANPCDRLSSVDQRVKEAIHRANCSRGRSFRANCPGSEKENIAAISGAGLLSYTARNLIISCTALEI